MAANWIVSAAKALVGQNPITAPFMQFLAEQEGQAIDARLKRLEDPISAIHPDIRPLSERLYNALWEAPSSSVEVSSAMATQYGRALALLESRGYVSAQHAIGSRFAGGLRIVSPEYVFYLCVSFEDQDVMERFIKRIDDTPPGTWIHGTEIKGDFGLPLTIIRPIFELYASRGLGILSNEIGTANYRVIA